MNRHLAHELSTLMDKHGVSATAIAEQTGLPNSLISRAVNARNRIKNENVRQLAAFFAGHSIEDAARLQAAHLLDQLGGKGSELIVLGLKDARGTASMFRLMAMA